MLSSPLPSPQKKRHLVFSCQLGALRCFPLSCLHPPGRGVPGQGGCSRGQGWTGGEGAAGLQGPPVGSCPLPQHPCCSSPPCVGELEVNGWEKEDFGHGSRQGGGQGGYGR